MKTAIRGVTMGCLIAGIGGCSGMPVVVTPWGQAELAEENVAICAQHSSNLNSPMPADTRANTIKDMRKRKCPNTPAE